GACERSSARRSNIFRHPSSVSGCFLFGGLDELIQCFEYGFKPFLSFCRHSWTQFGAMLCEVAGRTIHIESHVVLEWVLLKVLLESAHDAWMLRKVALVDAL